MRVTYFQRRPAQGCYSLENYFASVRRNLPPDICATVAESRYFSRGVFPRVYNILEASLRQGDINHITGDVHILSYLMRRHRTVLTIADCTPLYSSKGVRRSILKALWYDIPCWRSAEITVISRSVKQDLLEWCPIDPERVHVVPIHIAEHFRPVDQRNPGKRLRLLQIGTAPNKNIERLAAAISGIDCELHLVGMLNDSQRAALVRANVRFTQKVALSDADMLQEYIDCDILVFASTMEGFGMPILEANSVGRPVVTSNRSSMPEVAGEAACLVDPYEVDSIREGILRLANDADYARRLVAAGFLNAQRYNVKNVVDAYVRIYRKLADAND